MHAHTLTTPCPHNTPPCRDWLAHGLELSCRSLHGERGLWKHDWLLLTYVTYHLDYHALDIAAAQQDEPRACAMQDILVVTGPKYIALRLAMPQSGRSYARHPCRKPRVRRIEHVYTHAPRPAVSAWSDHMLPYSSITATHLLLSALYTGLETRFVCDYQSPL